MRHVRRSRACHSSRPARARQMRVTRLSIMPWAWRAGATRVTSASDGDADERSGAGASEADVPSEMHAELVREDYMLM